MRQRDYEKSKNVQRLVSARRYHDDNQLLCHVRRGGEGWLTQVMRGAQPRRALLSFLHSRIEENDTYRDAITFHYGTTIEGLSLPENLQSMEAEACVRVRCMDGTIVNYSTTKVLGCDGMNSKIRTGLKAWATEYREWHIQSKKAHDRFGLHYIDSKSAGLRYKILTMLDNSPLTIMDPTNITKNELCYSYISKSKPGSKGGFRLGLLPLKMAGIPRTANIIARSTAPIFMLTTGMELIEYLKSEFLQCDVDRMIALEEAERFAKSPGGIFPKSQYCLESQVTLGDGGGGNGVVNEQGQGNGGGIVLLGDAIHAFPPDLGAGVNIAFLDVLNLLDALDECNGDWSRALPQYEESRAIQSRAICELIPIGFPEQYNHMPMRKSIKLLGVGMRVALSKAIPRLFSPPVFFMCQDVNLDYSQVWEKAKRTTRNLFGLGFAMVVAMLGTILRRFTLIS